MMRLKSKLLSLNANKTVPTKVFSPANCEELRIPFRQDKVAKVVGRLANSIQVPTALPSPPSSTDEEDEARDEKKSKLHISGAEGQIVSGILVQNDFKLSLMAPEDLKEYAGLTTTTILCRQRLTLSAASVDLVKWALEGTFGAIRTLSSASTNGNKMDVDSNGNGTKTEEEAADEEINRPIETIFEVMGVVHVKCRDRGEIEVEWEGNIANDGIADAVLAVLFTVESSPAAAKREFRLLPIYTIQISPDTDKDLDSSKQHSHSHEPMPRNLHANITPEERLSRLCMFLEAQFGEDAITPISKPKLPSIVISEDAVTVEKAEAAELDRLHKSGIPVPGLEIRVDKAVVKVWLETLEVEGGNRSLSDRVKAVVERAVEVVAPLWE